MYTNINQTNLTEFTKSDIMLVIYQKNDHYITNFKRNLIIELKENYSLGFREITDLLRDAYFNVKNIYFNAIKHGIN